MSAYRALMKMRLAALATFIVVVTAGGVSGQMDCPEITETALESVIEQIIPNGDNPSTPNVDVLDFHPVCLAYSQERDRYRFVSVVVEYTCTGNANCPSGTAVEQFDSQCSSGTWSNSVLFDIDNIRTVNPTANFSATTREDCALCLSPATADSFSLTTDTVTHCVACDSSCNEGLMRCYGLQDTQCCQYYNASMCVDTCPSPLISDGEFNCNCPSGLTGSNCSQYQVCPDLGNRVSGGTVQYSQFLLQGGYPEGTTATVTCSEGYTGGGNITCQSESWSGNLPGCTTVAISLPLYFPTKEVRGRAGCYPEDTAQDRMEIDEQIRQIIQEDLAAIGSGSLSEQ